VDFMVFLTNASGIFQEDHWYMWHIYLITAFGCPIFQILEKEQTYNLTETRKDSSPSKFISY
jgi:hypothetical protein